MGVKDINFSRLDVGFVSAPASMDIHLQASMTDPFMVGCTIHLVPLRVARVLLVCFRVPLLSPHSFALVVHRPWPMPGSPCYLFNNSGTGAVMPIIDISGYHPQLLLSHSGLSLLFQLQLSFKGGVSLTMWCMSSSPSNSLLGMLLVR